MSVVKCLICDQPIPQTERVGHAFKFHEITLDEVIDHNVFGKATWECDVPDCSDGICPGCGEFTESIKVCSPVKKDGKIVSYLIRCLNCKSLSMTQDIESFLPVTNEGCGPVLVINNRTCLNCDNMNHNKEKNLYVCNSYASEVYIGENSLSIAQTCDDYKSKEDEGIEDEQ
jgi:hypothetical protein